VRAVGRIGDEHKSRHPRLDDEGVAAGKIEQDFFGSPSHGDNGFAFTAALDRGQIGPQDNRPAFTAGAAEFDDPPAFDRRANPPHHRFDFRQFGHG
jgi:hypothetical protein